MTTLITNIKQLVGVSETSKPDSYRVLRGKELAELPVIENAYLVIEAGSISEYGAMNSIQNSTLKIQNKIDASGQMVLPCWCDSHTHLVFASSREEEFVDKIKGMSYAEIAARGGGILNSARKLNETSEDQLFNSAWKRLEEVSSLGTGAIEIKSGYGLTVRRGTENASGNKKIERALKYFNQVNIFWVHMLIRWNLRTITRDILIVLSTKCCR